MRGGKKGPRHVGLLVQPAVPTYRVPRRRCCFGVVVDVTVASSLTTSAVLIAFVGGMVLGQVAAVHGKQNN